MVKLGILRNESTATLLKTEQAELKYEMKQRWKMKETSTNPKATFETVKTRKQN